MAMRLSDDSDDAVSSKIAYQTVNVRGEVPYSSGWFPNDGRVAVLVLFDVDIIIIIIVGVSRRHADDRGKVQPIGNVFGDERSHGGLPSHVPAAAGWGYA